MQIYYYYHYYYDYNTSVDGVFKMLFRDELVFKIYLYIIIIRRQSESGEYRFDQ